MAKCGGEIGRSFDKYITHYINIQVKEDTFDGGLRLKKDVTWIFKMNACR